MSIDAETFFLCCNEKNSEHNQSLSHSERDSLHQFSAARYSFLFITSSWSFSQGEYLVPIFTQRLNLNE